MSRIADLALKAGIKLPVGAAERLEAYAELLRASNDRVNLVARTDIGHVAERHVLHSLALLRRTFPSAARVVDWGTGGGLPLVPLSICFPEVAFVGVDAVEKKTLAVRAMARSLGLSNLETWHGRAETYRAPHTHSVSRATAPLATLWAWHAPGATGIDVPEGAWFAGMVVLKGGEIGDEIANLQQIAPHLDVRIEPIGLPGAYYADKHIVTVRALQDEPG